MVNPLSEFAPTLHVGSTITIEELTSTSPGGQPRVVVLVGPALPIKGGAKWGGDTRLVTTWYAGNGTEASQQNLGPVEMPSDFNGEWNRTRMGRAPSSYTDEHGVKSQIVEPMDLYQILDAIRIGGARLRVTWAAVGTRAPGVFATSRNVDVRIVREGRMKTFEITPDTEVDIHWTMNFEWVSRGGGQAKVASVRRTDDLSSATTAVQQSIVALDELVDAKLNTLNALKRLSASNFTLGQLEKLAGAPLKLMNDAVAKLRYNVNQFKRVAEVVRKIANTPTALANSAIDFARNTTAIANQFVHELGQTPVELLSNRSKVSDLARAQKHFASVASQMSIVARRGAELDAKLRQPVVAGSNRGTVSVRSSATTRPGDMLAIHLCKEGDTPDRLSARYYGSPDHTDAILRANRLPLHTPTFRRGQIVVIPSLSSASRA